MDKKEIEVTKFALTNNVNKVQKKQIEAMNDVAMNSMPKQSLCDTCCKVFVCPMQHIDHREKCGLYEPLPNPLDEIVTETRSLNPSKEEKSMESAERIEITFKSGETISYGKGEWDDYAYDGKAVIVKKNSAWIGIYNFDDVFCVELKEK